MADTTTTSSTNATTIKTTGNDDILAPVLAVLSSAEYMKSLGAAMQEAVKSGLIAAQADEEYQTSQFDVMASAGRQWYLDAKDELEQKETYRQNQEQSKQMLAMLTDMDDNSKEARIARLLSVDRKSGWETLNDSFNEKFDALLNEKSPSGISGALSKLTSSLESGIEHAAKTYAPKVGRAAGNASNNISDFLSENADIGGRIAEKATNGLGQLMQRVAKIGDTLSDKAEKASASTENISIGGKWLSSYYKGLSGVIDKISNLADTKGKSLENMSADIGLAVERGMQGASDRMKEAGDALIKKSNYADLAWNGKVNGQLPQQPVNNAEVNVKTDNPTIQHAMQPSPESGINLMTAVQRPMDSGAAQLEATRKEATYRLQTEIQPAFYNKANAFFDTIDVNELNGLGEGVKGMGAKVAGGLGGALKGMGMAALLTATVASLGQIYTAVNAFKDAWSADAEADKNITENAEANAQNMENKYGGTSMEGIGNKSAELMKAEAEAASNDNSLGDSVKNKLGGFFSTITGGLYQSDQQEREARVAQLKAELDAEYAKFDEQKAAAAKAGYKIGDEFHTNTEAVDAWIRDGKPEQRQSVQSTMPAMAAGTTLNNSQPTASTPAADVKTENVETPEQKAEREKKAMVEGIKEGFTSSEVKEMLHENAKETGKSMEGQLMGA